MGPSIFTMYKRIYNVKSSLAVTRVSLVTEGTV